MDPKETPNRKNNFEEKKQEVSHSSFQTCGRGKGRKKFTTVDKFLDGLIK